MGESWGELDAIGMDQSWIRKLWESCVRRGVIVGESAAARAAIVYKGEAIHCRQSQANVLGDHGLPRTTTRKTKDKKTCLKKGPKEASTRPEKTVSCE